MITTSHWPFLIFVLVNFDMVGIGRMDLLELFMWMLTQPTIDMSKELEDMEMEVSRKDCVSLE